MTGSGRHAPRNRAAADVPVPDRHRARRWGTPLAALTLATAGAIAPVWLQPAGAALPANCIETGPTTVQCDYTGAGNYAFTVPTGVSALSVTAEGAPGGTIPNDSPADAGIGGRPAIVTGTLPVTSATVLQVFVGGTGGANGAGGFNGGGAGGPDASYGPGGGGGGASDVRTAADLASRVLVAAGGGGAGGDNNIDSAGGAGGDATTAGATGPYSLGGIVGTGGQPGTATGGGAAGAPGGAGAGSFGIGGTGGGQPPLARLWAPGGGGGGGWYGGGGGGSSDEAVDYASSGGGGGGSNLVPTGGAASIDTAANPVPHVRISYTIPAPLTVTFTSAPPPAGTVGQPYAYQYTASGDTGITYAVTSGALPVGLSMSSSGAASGTPTATGSYTYTVTATGSSGASATRTDTITVNPAAAPAASVSSSSLTFGSQNIGSASSPQQVTVTSTGTAPLRISAVTTTGDYAQTTTCPLNTDMAPGTSCTADVTFTPTAAGTRTGTLTFTDNAGNHTVQLTGTGQALVPGAGLTPASANLGNVDVGSTSSPATFTLSSTGTASLDMIAVSIGGPNAAEFAQSNDCPASLAPAATCHINVTFSPASPGAKSATLTVTDNAGTQTSNLTGTGVANADLTITGSATPNPVKSGGTLTYTLTAGNTGPQPGATVTVRDTLPTNAQYSSLSAPSGWTCTTPAVGQTGTVKCTASSLAVGSSAVFTLKVKVVAKGKATVSDTVTVAAGTTDPDPSDNSVTITTSVQGGNP